MKAMKSSTACRISGGHSTFSASFPSNHAELELSSPEARGSLGRRQFARRGPACTGSACGACARARRCPACACAGAGCFCCSLQPVLTRAAELEPAGTPLPPWRRMSPAPPVHALAAATPAELGAAAGPHFLRTFYPQCLQAFPLLTCSSLKRCVLAGMWSMHRIEQWDQRRFRGSAHPSFADWRSAHTLSDGRAVGWTSGGRPREQINNLDGRVRARPQ